MNAEIVCPTAEEIGAVAAACAWPSVEVQLAGRSRPVRVVGNRLAWEGYIRWADGPALLAAFDALEAWEIELQHDLGRSWPLLVVSERTATG